MTPPEVPSRQELVFSRDGNFRETLEGPAGPGGMVAVKIIKVLGTSEESWEHAAEQAVEQATQTVENVSGVEVEDWTANVENGEIVEYKATVEMAFPVHESSP